MNENFNPFAEMRKLLSAPGDKLTMSKDADGTLIVTLEHKTETETEKPVKKAPKRVPTGDEVLNKSHNSKWWSRYHFLKNAFKLVFARLTENTPASRFLSTEVADAMAYVLCLRPQTCKRHITRAIKLGILIKEQEGNRFFLSLAKKTDDTQEGDKYSDILP